MWVVKEVGLWPFTHTLVILNPSCMLGTLGFYLGGVGEPAKVIFLKSPRLPPVTIPVDYNVQQEQTFSVKGQLVNNVGFAGRTLSVTTI